MEEVKKNNKLFIERTEYALQQYKDNLKKEEQSFDRTLFINACIGLLVLPNEELYNQLPKGSVADWGISEDAITIDENKSIRNVARHLRNAITHNHFDFDSGQDEGVSLPIERLTFTDFKKQEVESFKATMDFETFEQFVLKIAEFAKKHYNEER